MSVDGTAQLTAQAVVSISLRVRLRRSAESLWVGLGDSYFVLAGPAIRMWELVDGRASLAEIASVVAREYGVDEATVLADAVDSLGPLVAGRVLRVET